LTYKTSMTFSDTCNMPISRRKWFVSRVIQQLEAEQPKEPLLPPPIPPLPK